MGAMSSDVSAAALAARQVLKVKQRTFGVAAARTCGVLCCDPHFDEAGVEFATVQVSIEYMALVAQLARSLGKIRGYAVVRLGDPDVPGRLGLYEFKVQTELYGAWFFALGSRSELERLGFELQEGGAG